MIRVIVSQALLYIVESHFIDEHAGSIMANACIGESFSMELLSALAILVIAPSGALILR